MPEFATPIEEDKEINEKVNQYEAAASVEVPFPKPDNPACNPVPEVDYDDESGVPIIPQDLTALPSRDLGRLFQAIEAWEDYFRSLATEADQEKVKRKEIADLVKAHVKKEMRSQKIAKDEVNEYVKLDPRYIQANTAYLEARFQAEQIEDLKSTVSRRFNMISREITRRGDDRYGQFDLDRRGSGHPKPSGGDSGFGTGTHRFD